MFVPETRGGMVGCDRRHQEQLTPVNQTSHTATEGEGETGLCCPISRTLQLHDFFHE